MSIKVVVHGVFNIGRGGPAGVVVFTSSTTKPLYGMTAAEVSCPGQSEHLASTSGSTANGKGSVLPSVSTSVPVVVTQFTSDNCGRYTEYVDHANDDPSCYRPVQTSWFPMHLHALLEYAETEGKEDVISWVPHGRCVLIRQKNQLKELHGFDPKYATVRYESFLKNLNNWSFKQISTGKDKGGFYHKSFLCGREFLV